MTDNFRCTTIVNSGLIETSSTENFIILALEIPFWHPRIHQLVEILPVQLENSFMKLQFQVFCECAIASPIRRKLNFSRALISEVKLVQRTYSPGLFMEILPFDVTIDAIVSSADIA